MDSEASTELTEISKNTNTESSENTPEIIKNSPKRGSTIDMTLFNGEKKEYTFELISDTKNNLVHLVFSEPMSFLSLTAEQAYELGRKLKVHSKRINQK